MRYTLLLSVSLVFMWMCCCSTDKNININKEDEMMLLTLEEASITAVEVSGDENAYTFNVSILSPDTGCEQYADWWEIIDLDGNLIYRRILGHSHVDEQPFTRSGSPVEISANLEVYIRTHMNNTGYSKNVQKGTVANGFSAIELDVEFAQVLAETNPLPSGCAF